MRITGAARLQSRPVGNLSGGWKMKLALSRAVLRKADILLLDEPTNHLDTTNVQWLMDYLCSMDSISSMIVSHDSGFLDTVCTHIIHYENRKLKTYRGTLSDFVKNVRHRPPGLFLVFGAVPAAPLHALCQELECCRAEHLKSCICCGALLWSLLGVCRLISRSNAARQDCEGRQLAATMKAL